MYYNIPWDPHEWDESGGSAVKVQVLVLARADVNAVDKGGDFLTKQGLCWSFKTWEYNGDTLW